MENLASSAAEFEQHAKIDLDVEEIEAAADIVVGLVRGEDPQSYRSRVQELCEAHPVP